VPGQHDAQIGICDLAIERTKPGAVSLALDLDSTEGGMRNVVMFFGAHE
jgi:hypothetical protein